MVENVVFENIQNYVLSVKNWSAFYS